MVGAEGLQLGGVALWEQGVHGTIWDWARVCDCSVLIIEAVLCVQMNTQRVLITTALIVWGF